MNVRRATIEDVEAMARVHWLSSNTAYGRDDPLERRLASTREVFTLDDVRAYLAEGDGGEVIGILVVGTDELYAIYVHPDWWGRGAGQALLDQAHDALAETCEEAELTVLVANPRARRFYERNGWHVDDVRTELHFGGIPVEVAKYRKRFTQVPGT